MSRLTFKTSKPIEPTLPSRMDVAMFVGFVSRRENKAAPEVVLDWLKKNGFTSSDELLDVPVPIESWEMFDQLFAWDKRGVLENPSDEQIELETYLGSAVHAFFQQGGKKCYVVRAGDNVTFGAPRLERLELIGKCIPEFAGSPGAYVDDRASWYGVAYLYGLPDVSLLSVPDLPELVAAEPDRLLGDIPVTETPPEEFVECSAHEADVVMDDISQYLIAPRCNDEAYDDWINAIRLLATMLENSKSGRATHLIASVPLPVKGSDVDKDLNGYFSEKGCLTGTIESNHNSICSAFVQLSYPWLKTEKRKLPEDLNVPEGVVSGLLARNALLRGCFRSVSYLPLVDIDNVFPMLNNRQMNMNHKTTDYALGDRISLFKPTANGVRLISDVTTSNNIDYRQSSVSRLVSLLVRECRRIGETMVFETSGDVLWRAIVDRLNVFLLFLYRAGAFNGASAAEAFQVRCDRSTMTQNDIDNGRAIVQIIFSAATSIESIVVTLTMDNAGQTVDVTAQTSEAA